MTANHVRNWFTILVKDDTMKFERRVNSHDETHSR